MKNAVDRDAAQRYVLAIGLLVSVDLADQGLGNSREAMFTVAPVGEETGFEWAASNQGRDVIVLAFEPGREAEGPTNIAVYEERNDTLHVWPKCAFCKTEDGRHFIIDHEDRIGFVLCDDKIMIVNNLPAGFCRENADRGAAFLNEFAARQFSASHLSGLQKS